MNFKFDLGFRVSMSIGAGCLILISVGHYAIDTIHWSYAFNAITVSIGSLILVFSRDD